MPDIRGKSEWKAERVGACLEPAHCALHDTAIDYFEPDGLSVANLIQSEIDTYRREQDSIAQFIEECCETFEQAKIDRPDEYIIPTDYRTVNTELYRAYKRFCEENGEYLRSHRRLSQNLQKRRLSPNEIRRPLLGRDQTLNFRLITAHSAHEVLAFFR